MKAAGTGYTRGVSDSVSVSPGTFSLARNIFRALFTVPPFLLQHLWRRRRVRDVTHTVDRLSEPAPDPSGIERSTEPDVQAAADGDGPLVLRSYEVDIRRADLSPEQLIERLLARPADLNDDRIAGFVRDDAPATDLRVDDELVVELPGPWNGPVRVTRAGPSGLLLQTLNGHMEAGQIRFDTTDHSHRSDGTHDYRFRIRSWARGGDRAFTLLHLGLRVAKELQTAMWVAMCEGAVTVSGGEREGRISVITEVLDDSTEPGDTVGEVMEKVGGN